MLNQPEQQKKADLKVPVIIEFQALDNKYTLRSLDNSHTITKEDIKDIVLACNEELIYRFLFRSGLHGKEYSEKEAVEFVQWAKKGWRDNSHFVFIILDAGGKIIGCIEISSDDIEHPLIGYWKTARVKGIMAGVVSCLIGIAREAGYRNLYAMVEPVNIRSSSLLKRTGFNLLGIRNLEMRFMGEPTGEYKLFEFYELVLVP
jgi:RimJ/RimL family protein N-acetyltransferase